MRALSAARPLSLLPALLLGLGLRPLAAQDSAHKATHEHGEHADPDHAVAGRRRAAGRLVGPLRRGCRRPRT